MSKLQEKLNGNFEEIEELDLSNRDIESIKGIGKLKNLKKLSLANTNIKDITPLADLKKLEVLDISYCSNIQGYFVFKNLPNLKELNIVGHDIENFNELYSLKTNIGLDKLIIGMDLFDTSGFVTLKDTLFEDALSLNITTEDDKVIFDASQKPHDVFN